MTEKKLRFVGTFAMSVVLALCLAPSASARTVQRPTIVNQVAIEMPDEVRDYIDRLKPYVTISEEGYILFDEEAAVNAGEDNLFIEKGNGVSQISRAFVDDPMSTIETLTREGIPFYGNWCGPGHSGPGAPIDIIDYYCREHDYCYEDRGYFNCSCNQTLLNGLFSVYSTLGFEQRNIADIIISTFYLMPCIP